MLLQSRSNTHTCKSGNETNSGGLSTSRRWMDEAVLAIQEAAKKLNSVSTQICGVEGKQDELLATIKVLSERVTNLEAATNYQACVRVSSKEKKHHPNVPLYERVRLSLLIFVHSCLLCTFCGCVP